MVAGPSARFSYWRLAMASRPDNGITAVLLYLVSPALDPDWDVGPLPVALPDWAAAAGWTEHDRADAAARSTYFDPGIQSVLYGEPGKPVRWSHFVEAELGDCDVWGVELVRLPILGPPQAMVAVHVRLPTHNPIAVMERLVRIRGASDGLLNDEFAALLPSGWTLSPLQRRG